MATYRNSNDDEVIYLGSEFKLKVHMDSIPVIGGATYDMGSDNINFTCTFYTNSSKKVTLTKSQMQPVTDDITTYVACLDSTTLGKGTLTVEYRVDVPDEEFDDDLRSEVVVIPTKLKIK